jgi:hypothetical protein
VVWKLPSAAAVTAPVKGALAMLPAFPWYAWAGLGVGAAILLGGGVAAAATAGGGDAGHGPTPKPGGTPPVLKLGSTGDWVSYLQDRLAMTVTGTFDAATDAAVKAYQSANGLTADGIVGPASWSKLGVGDAAQPGSGGGGSAPQPAPKPQPAPQPAPPGPVTSGNPFGLSQGIADREGQILTHIGNGNVEHQWWPLDYTTSDGHQIHVEISRRALALNDGTNRLMVSMTYKGQQKIADMIGGSMLTTRLADEIWKHAQKKLGVINQNAWVTDGSMGHTDRMYQQSDIIQGKVGGADGLVGNEGKDWVITRRFWTPPQGTNDGSKSVHNSANFGWYGAGSGHSPGGELVMQSIGLVHDMNHADYSQLSRFVRQGSLTIDGQPWDWGAALADPTVSKYIQDEGGTIPSSRHPDL